MINELLAAGGALVFCGSVAYSFYRGWQSGYNAGRTIVESYEDGFEDGGEEHWDNPGSERSALEVCAAKASKKVRGLLQ